MPISPLSAPVASVTTPAPATENRAENRAENRQDLRKAGEQFEALMLEQLLAAARPKTSGPEADWRAMADRAVAENLARQSPLGLAALIERSVK